MKRIIILLSFILLSGCTAEYNIKYINKEYLEEFIVEANNNEYCGDNLCSQYIGDYYNTNISVNYLDSEEELAFSDNLSKYTLYDKKLINDSNKYGFLLKHTYNLPTQYSNSYVGRKLFNNIIVNEDFIKVYDINNIFLNYSFLERINISFETDKYVASTNCDEERNGVYYWYIDKNNYKDKVINISFDQKVNKSKEIVNNGYLTWNSIKYLFVVIILIFFIILLIFYEKVKKSNK